MGVQAILKVIKTIKLSYLVNNKNIDLYLYNTLYILKGGINLIFILKLWAKRVKIDFNNNNITITIKKFLKYLYFMAYMLLIFNN